MKELLEFLVRNLVEDQQAVSVEATAGTGSLLLRVKVAPGEVGKIIGRQGRTVKAIRSLLAAMERKTGQHVAVEIAE